MITEILQYGLNCKKKQVNCLRRHAAFGDAAARRPERSSTAKIINSRITNSRDE
jgi:hypothetical protein